MGKFLEALYEQLSLYVKHSAWLSTAPERAKGDVSEAKVLTRLEQLQADRKDDSYEPDMPPVDAEYLLGYLFEAGPVMGGNMGVSALTHSEIRSFAKNVGIALHPWETRFLRKLSGEYLSASRLAEKRDCPAPWQPEIVGRRLTARSFKESIIAMTEL